MAETFAAENAACRLRQRAWAEIELRVIRANAASIKTMLGGAALMAVVKADAYGHGLVPVSRAALAGGADWLGVATVQEGVTLREAGIDAPTALLCAPAPTELAAAAAARLVVPIGDIAAVEACARHPDVEVCLDIDTGMGRSGVLPADALAVWRAAHDAGLNVTGLSTHFPDAECDPVRTAAEAASLHAAARCLKTQGARFQNIHLSNSAGILRLDAAGGTLVRAGLLLYGIAPAPGSPISTLPALALKARVASVRSLPAGHTVGYGHACTLLRPSRVATVLIGYGDGFQRRLSNRGAVLLHGRPAPILGRVCMDQIVVDVTDLPETAPGDIATCIGRDGALTITIEEVAAQIDTTPHEISTCLTSRLPRVTI